MMPSKPACWTRSSVPEASLSGVVAEQDGLGGPVDQAAEQGEVERFLDEVEDAVLEGLSPRSGHRRGR